MKRSLPKTLSIALATVVVTAFSATVAYAGSDKTHAGQADIIDVAVSSGQFNTLAAALEAADLVSTLEGDGPFTVFAPTDAAFEALPEGTVDSLLRPENRDQLVSILTYHVVPGRVLAADVANLSEAETVNGKAVAIKLIDGKVMIDEATVVATDVAASNGVIHVIDKVMLPM